MNWIISGLTFLFLKKLQTMLRDYKYITTLKSIYKESAWEEFINSDKYDATKEYILVKNQIWIIYQLI